MRDGDVVLFVGDELIDAPEPRISTNFPFLVETFLTARYPGLHARYIYSGWNGDTVGRALLRLDRDVLSRKPTLVVVCLGLNDPEYSLHSEDRLGQFKKDLGELTRRLGQAGARVWLVSPPAVREDVGRSARIVRDGQSSIVNLQAIHYNATLALFTAAIREVAEASASGFVNWYAASVAMRPSAVQPGGFWRDGRLPPPQSHALVAAELLRAWQAEPLQVAIEMNWRMPGAAVAIQESPPVPVPVEATEDGRRTLILDGLPLPWPIPGAQAGLQPEWEAAGMCQFVLHVPDPPIRGITLRLDATDGSQAGALTLTAAQLLSGFNLAATEPLRKLRPVQDLLQAIGLKNYYQYSTWRRQELTPPREPELAGAQRQLVGALYAYATGYERIIRRLPKTFSTRLVLQEYVPPERVPTAGPLSTRLFGPPASRPATQPRP